MHATGKNLYLFITTMRQMSNRALMKNKASTDSLSKFIILLFICGGFISSLSAQDWRLYPSDDTTQSASNSGFQTKIDTELTKGPDSLEGPEKYYQGEYVPPGTIDLNTDPRVKGLLRRYGQYCDKNRNITGWRIQIFMASGLNSKEKATKEMVTFLQKYPDMSAYHVSQPPHYKVRVGDFRTKLEATRALRDIQKQYPDCFIVRDEIDPTKL